MCGNWGVLCLAEFLSLHHDRTPRGLLPSLIEKLLRGMINVIELRGAQAGGFNLLQGASIHTVQQCRVRALKPKRGDLGQTLFDKARKELRRSVLWKKITCRCFNSLDCPILVQGHSRFGTSSSPAVVETHPHQWSPPENYPVWSWSNEVGWQRQSCAVSLTITHNGDFDAWTPYRKTTVGVSDLNMWLSRVLGVKNDTSGDSPNIAGVLELLTCQGMWYQSVRQAYHLYVAAHVEQACGWMPLSRDAPSTVPSKSVLKIWANVMETEFKHLVNIDGSSLLLAEDGYLFEEFLVNCETKLQEGKSGDLLKEWVSPQKLRTFVLAAVGGFRDNDMLSVTTAFLRRAEGTFGISVTISTHPEKVVLAARGQPISVGFGGCVNPSYPTIAYWSSEPAALDTLNKTDVMIEKRFDLDDHGGEVVELCIMRHADWMVQLDGVSFGVDMQNTFAVSLTNSDMPQDSLPNLLVMRGLDFSCHAEASEDWFPNLLTQESFQKRLVPISEQPPPAGPSRQSSRCKELFGINQDCVAKDIAHIPWIVRKIDLTWSDSKSLNRRSSDNFNTKILNALRCKDSGFSGSGQGKEKGPRGRVDLVVFGVETSLWLGQQFVADLQRLFPTLNVVAMSSNVLMGLLQRGAGHVNPSNWVYTEDSLGIDKDTVGLALSHSGTTYPTVWAARLFIQHTKNLFALSSAFDGLLACSIGQGPSQEFKGLLFSTLAGIRPAEASTVATLAMHHTLSYLLLYCAAAANSVRLPSMTEKTRREIVEGTVDDELEEEIEEEEADECSSKICAASPSCVHDMYRVLLSMYWGMASSCGIDGHGCQVPGCNTELIGAGRRWSHHITESYWATFLPAAYVIITVIPGFLPVTRFGEGLANNWVDELPDYALWLLRVLDSGLYVFMGIIVAMVHRKLTGRRLWARFTTRTLLLVESTVNYKILRAYTSKLVALSYRFATISVVGQNGADHMVHEYTHKAQSDVLLAVGLPDGRVPSTAPVEGCVLMSCSQAQFIKQEGHGVETYGLGHNTWSRPNLFVKATKLPTFRPVFATEKMLLFEQFHSNSKVVPGQHGASPGTIVQRRKDMSKQKLDPYGMPKMQVTPNDLKKYMAVNDWLDFKRALHILEDIIDKHCLEAHMELVPLGLSQFLSQFMSEHPGSQRVFVHSPVKRYVSPVKYYESEEASQPKHSPEKRYESPVKHYAVEKISQPKHSPEKRYASPVKCYPVDKRSQAKKGPPPLKYESPAKMSEQSRSPSKLLLELTLSPKLTNRLRWKQEQNGTSGIEDVRNRISLFLDNMVEQQSKEHGGQGLIQQTTSNLSTYLDANEFLALLHGEELQTWVRSARYRWSKICKVRGLLSLLAEDHGIKRQSANSAVLTSGLTLRHFVMPWRKQALKTKLSTPSQKSTTGKYKRSSVQRASIEESQQMSFRKIAINNDSDGDLMYENMAAHGRSLGQHLVDSGASTMDIFNQSRPTELFYESRVASAERLVGWFVLLHAMCEPSSRLPFLRYELGKSESRLRVASTPAPVPLHELEVPNKSDAQRECRDDVFIPAARHQDVAIVNCGDKYGEESTSPETWM